MFFILHGNEFELKNKGTFYRRKTKVAEMLHIKVSLKV